MTRPAIEVPVEEPSDEREFITYCVYHAYYKGVEFFDTDEYLEAEINFAVEMGFEFEEYDDESPESRWNRLLESLARQTHFALADIHRLNGYHNRPA